MYVQLEQMRQVVLVSCVLLVCLLVLAAATLDNISWWQQSFPDAFMTQTSVRDLLSRSAIELQTNIRENYIISFTIAYSLYEHN